MKSLKEIFKCPCLARYVRFYPKHEDTTILLVIKLKFLKKIIKYEIQNNTILLLVVEYYHKPGCPYELQQVLNRIYLPDYYKLLPELTYDGKFTVESEDYFITKVTIITRIRTKKSGDEEKEKEKSDEKFERPENRLKRFEDLAKISKDQKEVGSSRTKTDERVHKEDAKKIDDEESQGESSQRDENRDSKQNKNENEYSERNNGSNTEEESTKMLEKESETASEDGKQIYSKKSERSTSEQVYKCPCSGSVSDFETKRIQTTITVAARIQFLRKIIKIQIRDNKFIFLYVEYNHKSDCPNSTKIIPIELMLPDDCHLLPELKYDVTYEIEFVNTLTSKVTITIKATSENRDDKQDSHEENDDKVSEEKNDKELKDDNNGRTETDEMCHKESEEHITDKASQEESSERDGERKVENNEKECHERNNGNRTEQGSMLETKSETENDANKEMYFTDTKILSSALLFKCPCNTLISDFETKRDKSTIVMSTKIKFLRSIRNHKVRDNKFIFLNVEYSHNYLCPNSSKITTIQLTLPDNCHLPPELKYDLTYEIEAVDVFTSEVTIIIKHENKNGDDEVDSHNERTKEENEAKTSEVNSEKIIHDKLKAEEKDESQEICKEKLKKESDCNKEIYVADIKMLSSKLLFKCPCNTPIPDFETKRDQSTIVMSGKIQFLRSIRNYEIRDNKFIFLNVEYSHKYLCPNSYKITTLQLTLPDNCHLPPELTYNLTCEIKAEDIFTSKVTIMVKLESANRDDKVDSHKEMKEEENEMMLSEVKTEKKIPEELKAEENDEPRETCKEKLKNESDDNKEIYFADIEMLPSTLLIKCPCNTPVSVCEAKRDQSTIVMSVKIQFLRSIQNYEIRDHKFILLNVEYSHNYVCPNISKIITIQLTLPDNCHLTPESRYDLTYEAKAEDLITSKVTIIITIKSENKDYKVDSYKETTEEENEVEIYEVKTEKKNHEELKAEEKDGPQAICEERLKKETNENALKEFEDETKNEGDEDKREEKNDKIETIEKLYNETAEQINEKVSQKESNQTDEKKEVETNEIEYLERNHGNKTDEEKIAMLENECNTERDEEEDKKEEETENKTHEESQSQTNSKSTEEVTESEGRQEGSAMATTTKEKLLAQISSHLDSNGSRVTVVGAGAVGMACAFSLLTQNIASDIAIVDVDENKLKGEGMDLLHGSLFMDNPKITYSTNYSITEKSRVCIVTAGARQREGESRLNLVQRNAVLMGKIIPQLIHYSPETILLMVSNPVDIMTYLAWKISGIDRHRVIGSGTNLDSSRFRYLLAQRLGVATTSCHASIIGEHGDSSVPVWSAVNVAGVLLKDLNPLIGEEGDNENWAEVHTEVVNSADEIIRLKGYTSWAVGLSCASLTRSIIKNTQTVHPVSVFAKGQHEITQDVFLSLPAALGSNGVESIIKQNLTENEKQRLQQSAAAIDQIQSSITL